MAAERYQNRNFKRGPAHTINEMIRHPQVRITGIHPDTGEKLESRVMSSQDALKLARELGVDLVEVTREANPPVCKIIDYKKFLYELKQRDKDRKKNQTQAELKELRLTPTTDEHDLNFKTKHAEHWLKDGNRVQAVVVFRGRGIIYKDQGRDILAKLAAALEGVGKVEQQPKMEGKRMFMMIVPK